MPRPYALQVTSAPTKVSEATWTQWYTDEHIRDLVYSGVSRTSAVYRAATATLTCNEPDNSVQPRKNEVDSSTFLALYQSDTKNVLEACQSPDLKCKVRIQSTLFPDNQSCYDCGTFQPLELQLVEILGSYETREDVAPWLLHHVIWGEGIENKIQFDHVNAVARLAGYRRTLLYRGVEGGVGVKEGGESFVVLVHEFDGEVNEEALPDVGRELEGIGPTSGCRFRLREYRLLESEGFGGECRVPERMEQ